MTRTALALAIASLLGVGAAHGQQSIHPKNPVEQLDPYERQRAATEEYMRRIANTPQPLPQQLATTYDKIKAPLPIGRIAGMQIWPTTPIKVVVENDEGGLISAYDARWQQIAAQNGPVDILGLCQSACTLALAYIPKERLCFGEDARLNFHHARVGSWQGPVSMVDCG